MESSNTKDKAIFSTEKGYMKKEFWYSSILA